MILSTIELIRTSAEEYKLCNADVHYKQGKNYDEWFMAMITN